MMRLRQAKKLLTKQVKDWVWIISLSGLIKLERRYIAAFARVSEESFKSAFRRVARRRDIAEKIGYSESSLPGSRSEWPGCWQ